MENNHTQLGRKKLMQRYLRRSFFLILYLSVAILSGCKIIDKKLQYPLKEITAPGDLFTDLAQVQIALSRKKDDQTIGYITTLDRSEQIEFALINKGRELKVSPDGSLVVYSFTETIGGELRSSLWLYDLNSREEKRVILWPDKLSEITLANPNFFPDGGNLIFSITEYETDTTSLGSIDLDGANLKLIDTPAKTLSTGPIVSPDGEKILVLCEGLDKDSGQPGFMLCIMDANGSHRFRLVENGDYHDTYLFTPDSQFIIYSELEWGGLFGLGNPPHYEIKRIDINGKNEKTILKWYRDVNVLALSEDGTEIIFRDRFEERKPSKLYIIGIDGQNLRHLVYFDEFLANWYGDD